MDLIRDFRDASYIKGILGAIKSESYRPINIMEICGGHTHTIMRFGLNQLLSDNINFVHGPGCPVCIIPKERIDHAILLSRQEDIILATLGDMMRVPGSLGSLIKERAEGRDIRMIYSPMDVIDIAKKNPDKMVVYFAIGFETTTPMTAALLDLTIQAGIKNIFLHVNHVLVPPPINAIMSSGDISIDAFIGPGHVSAITGTKIYEPIVKRYKTPVVIAGFEPLDILQAVLMIMRQFKENRCEVENQYKRGVNIEGNKKAQGLIKKYFETRDSFRWRGLGDIPESGLKLRDEFAKWDAEVVFSDILNVKPVDDHVLCRCGDILRGRIKPFDCIIFGKACTPENPFGPCMVSSEGACQAYYKYSMESVV